MMKSINYAFPQDIRIGEIPPRGGKAKKSAEYLKNIFS